MGCVKFVPLVIFILIASAMPPTIMAGGPAARSHNEILIVKPTGNGPYKTGYTYENLSFSTKSYTTKIKIFYPAVTTGQNTTGNLSGAPYPTIVWFPGTCCTTETYTDLLVGMASWGLVTVTVGLDLLDYEHSGNSSDLEELLDHLETVNITPGAILYKMVDKEAFGLSGHSSGGGLALIDAPFVDRIEAVQPMAAAITSGTIDYLAGLWHKPILCQYGSRDQDYGNGCKYLFDKFPAPKSVVEVTGSDHFGPFELHLVVSFYYYYLHHKADYWTFLYGPEAINDTANGAYSLKFKTSDTHWFPPIVHAALAWPSAPMDTAVPFTGDIQGYIIPTFNSARFAWDFDGDGIDDYQDKEDVNLSYAYPNPGSFAPVLYYRIGQATFRCEENLSIEVVDVPPVASAGKDILVPEDSLAEFDASLSHDTASDNATLIYRWDFGDGNSTSYNSSPLATHSYEKAGTYNATLQVKDRHGEVTEDVAKVTVSNLAPTADAGEDVRVAEDVEVMLDGIGGDTPSDLPALMFRWDLGDGNSTEWSDSPTARHVYTQQGNHTAVFYVRDEDRSVTNDSLVVEVYDIAPAAQILAPVDGAEFPMDREIGFMGWAGDSSSDIPTMMFRWDFGDGNTTGWSREGGVNHTFTAIGEYAVTLEARDDEGTVDKAFVRIEILNVQPDARILTPDREPYITEDDAVIFAGKGTDTPSDLPRLTMVWEIEGAVYLGASARHVFTNSGTYTAVFRVTDPQGRNDTASITVHVFNVAPTMTAKVEPLVVVLGQNVNFSAVANDTPSDMATIKYLWDFGDKTTSSAASGNHTYRGVGTYTMTVKAIDNDGGEATELYTITVMKPKIVEPPVKNAEGANPLLLEIALLALGLIGIVLMAMAFSTKEAPVKEPPRPAKKGPKRSKKKAKGN